VRGDDEKHTGDRERYSRDDCPSSAQLQLRDLRGGQPDPRKEQEQEPDFGKAYARLTSERKFRSCAALSRRAAGHYAEPVAGRGLEFPVFADRWAFGRLQLAAADVALPRGGRIRLSMGRGPE
jgi:hypothetical protein